MRSFVRKSIKGGRCTALNQYYKYINSDEVISFISTEINYIGYVCEILDKYIEFINEHSEC